MRSTFIAAALVTPVLAAACSKPSPREGTASEQFRAPALTVPLPSEMPRTSALEAGETGLALLPGPHAGGQGRQARTNRPTARPRLLQDALLATPAQPQVSNSAGMTELAAPNSAPTAPTATAAPASGAMPAGGTVASGPADHGGGIIIIRGGIGSPRDPCAKHPHGAAAPQPTIAINNMMPQRGGYGGVLVNDRAPPRSGGGGFRPRGGIR